MRRTALVLPFLSLALAAQDATEKELLDLLNTPSPWPAPRPPRSARAPG